MNACRSQPPHQLCKTSSLTATENQQLEGEEQLWAPPKPHPQKTVTICPVWLLPGKTPFTGLVFICPDSMQLPVVVITSWGKQEAGQKSQKP